MKKNSNHRTDIIGTTALPKYGAFVSEEKCHLFGDVAGKKLLEICCGTGHSLKYHGDRKASELWEIACPIFFINQSIKTIKEDVLNKKFNMPKTPALKAFLTYIFLEYIFKTR